MLKDLITVLKLKQKINTKTKYDEVLQVLLVYKEYLKAINI